jgi:dihydrofolate synthase/folylpolyglutamate synthase
MGQLHPKKIDLSLGRIEALLNRLGNPQNKLPLVIHVAGTNGKGSVIALLRGMLEAAGHRVHTYTSPHLVRFHERIRLASGSGTSAFINEEALAAILDECEAANGDEPITFFEVTTAAAFLAFSRVPADVLILEVGLGGRLDATNTIHHPALTVITPISIDHVGFLGPNLGGIAREKAGILKPEVQAVIAPQDPQALTTIQDRAAKISAPLALWGRDWTVTANNPATMTVSVGEATHTLPKPALTGSHQIQNAGLAVACLDHLATLPVDDDAKSRGLRGTLWPGRLQQLTGALASRLPDQSELWLDGGHNPAAARALAATARDWASTDPKPLILVVGMLQTKNARDFLDALAPDADGMVAVPVAGEDASLSPASLASMASDAGLTMGIKDSLEDALDHIAKTRSSIPPRVLICGSLYMAGTALSADGFEMA